MAIPHGKYHIHKFERYSQEITSAVELYRERTGTDCTVPDHQHPYHLNIISQINEEGVHDEIERKMQPFCRGLIQGLGDAMLSKHTVIRSGEYSVRLVNRAVTNDLWLMYKSPILLLTYSTFPQQIRSIRDAEDHKVTIHPYGNVQQDEQLGLDQAMDLHVGAWRQSHGFPNGHFNDTVVMLLKSELGFTP